MNVEFIKFYESSRRDDVGLLTGTIHIRLPDFGLNIKGINVFKKKNYWFISLPSRKAFDKSQGKEINYLLVLFDEKEKNNELISVVRTEGRKFVEEYLNSTPEQPENIISSPKDSLRDLNQIENCKIDDNEKVIIEIPQKQDTKPILSVTVKEWVDPPKRQQTRLKSIKR